MKPIRICEENGLAIEEALAAVNGRAVEHTMVSYEQVAARAAEAERELEALDIPKIARPGAMWTCQSGKRLAVSYRFTARATSIRLLRRAAGWYLVGIWQSNIAAGSWPRRGRLELVPAQDARAVEVLRRRYDVAALVPPSADIVMLPTRGDAA